MLSFLLIIYYIYIALFINLDSKLLLHEISMLCKFSLDQLSQTPSEFVPGWVVIWELTTVSK